MSVSPSAPRPKLPGSPKACNVAVLACGEGLCVGRDSSDAVSRACSKEFPFTGGVVRKVAINVGKEGYVDLELKARAMMARE